MVLRGQNTIYSLIVGCLRIVSSLESVWIGVGGSVPLWSSLEYSWLDLQNQRLIRMTAGAKSQHDEDDAKNPQPKSNYQKQSGFFQETFKQTDTCKSWLTGRVLVGTFLCTDRDANVILGSCAEYVPTTGGSNEDEADLDACMKTNVDPRILGLAMVKGQHIIAMHFDDMTPVSVPKNSPQSERKVEEHMEKLCL